MHDSLDWDDLSDAELVEQYRRFRFVSAFRELVQRHQAPLFRLLTALAPASADVESLCEKCFLHAERRLKELEDPAGFFVWLVAIAQDVADDAHEQAKQPASEHTGAPLKHGLKAVVLEALQQLAPEDRLALVLGVVQERRAADVAAVLGIADEADVHTRIESACARMQTIMQTTASAPTSAEMPDPGAGEITVGMTLDRRYRIVKEIGRGGMGIVYRARHLGIDRDVAIKLLPKKFAQDHNMRSRFQREAMMLGRLEHPNFVRVIDSGQLEAGAEFIAMELLEGEPLIHAVKRDAPFEPMHALHMMRHVLRGLERAHALGIVHRDIKSANLIVLGHEDDDAFVKILDLGIARFSADAEAPVDAHQTEPGIVFGTPGYLSPELALGEEAGPSSDLYSATIVLFEMLAGRLPFVSHDPRAVLAMHVSRRPPSVADIAPAVALPDRVQQLIDRGLAKRPQDRFATAGEYLAAIDAIVPANYRYVKPTGASDGDASMDASIAATRRVARLAFAPTLPLQTVRAAPRWLWSLLIFVIATGVFALVTC